MNAREKNQGGEHQANNEVGAAVKVLGTDLTGATSVTFNGTAATITAASKFEIKTTVLRRVPNCSERHSIE
jgi:hypothetical protein